jgi:hypothetical protein
VPPGMIFSWKIVIGAGASVIGRKALYGVENSLIFGYTVENQSITFHVEIHPSLSKNARIANAMSKTGLGNVYFTTIVAPT